MLWRLLRAWGEDDREAAARWNDDVPGEPRDRGAARGDRADGLLAAPRSLRELGRSRAARSWTGSPSCPSPRRSPSCPRAWEIDARTTRSPPTSGRGWRTRCCAAVKAVPLGQTDGQRLLLALGARISTLARGARARARGRRSRAISRPGSRSCRRATRPSTRGSSAPRQPMDDKSTLRVGIGGPVGSGKTALTLALCRALRDKYDIAVVTNDIYTEEDAQFLVRNEALAAGAHHRRGDRRLPAHRDPRGRLDQPRGGGEAHDALSGARPDLHRVRRRQPRAPPSARSSPTSRST